MDQTTETVAAEQQPAQPDVQTTTTLTSETTTEQPKEIDFKTLIPEAYKEEKSLQNFSNMDDFVKSYFCLLYTSPSPRDLSTSRMPSSA